MDTNVAEAKEPQLVDVLEFAMQLKDMSRTQADRLQDVLTKLAYPEQPRKEEVDTPRIDLPMIGQASRDLQDALSNMTGIESKITELMRALG